MKQAFGTVSTTSGVAGEEVLQENTGKGASCHMYCVQFINFNICWPNSFMISFLINKLYIYIFFFILTIHFLPES